MIFRFPLLLPSDRMQPSFLSSRSVADRVRCRSLRQVAILRDAHAKADLPSAYQDVRLYLGVRVTTKLPFSRTSLQFISLLIPFQKLY